MLAFTEIGAKALVVVSLLWFATEGRKGKLVASARDTSAPTRGRIGCVSCSVTSVRRKSNAPGWVLGFEPFIKDKLAWN
jgi:hypothetical protein